MFSLVTVISAAVVFTSITVFSGFRNINSDIELFIESQRNLAEAETKHAVEYIYHTRFNSEYTETAKKTIINWINVYKFNLLFDQESSFVIYNGNGLLIAGEESEDFGDIANGNIHSARKKLLSVIKDILPLSPYGSQVCMSSQTAECAGASCTFCGYAASIPDWDWYIFTRVKHEPTITYRRLKQKHLLVTTLISTFAAAMTTVLLLFLSFRQSRKFSNSIADSFKKLDSYFSGEIEADHIAEEQDIEYQEFINLARYSIVTLKQKETAQKHLSTALQISGYISWEYDIESGSISHPDNLTSREFKAYSEMVVTPENLSEKNLAPLYGNKAEQLFRHIKSGKENSIYMEYKLRINHETEKWFNLYYQITQADADGKPSRLLGIASDITEKVNMSEMVIQSEKMLSAGSLAAGVAHELNNPLAGIIQNAYVLKNRLDPELEKNQSAADKTGISMEQLAEYCNTRGIIRLLDDIMSSGRRAADIISDMLVFSRKSRTSMSAQRLSEILDKTIQLASSDYELKKKYRFKDIEIKRSYDNDETEVMCEPEKMGQVFFNILKNGAQAMASKVYEDGIKPCFCLSVKNTVHGVQVAIEDNGPGLSEKLRSKIIEPFFTTKQASEGTGLGLSISYYIITDKHKGKMYIESEEMEWTRFIIELPAEDRNDNSSYN